MNFLELIMPVSVLLLAYLLLFSASSRIETTSEQKSVSE